MANLNKANQLFTVTAYWADGKVRGTADFTCADAYSAIVDAINWCVWAGPCCDDNGAMWAFNPDMLVGPKGGGAIPARDVVANWLAARLDRRAA